MPLPKRIMSPILSASLICSPIFVKGQAMSTVAAITRRQSTESEILNEQESLNDKTQQLADLNAILLIAHDEGDFKRDLHYAARAAEITTLTAVASIVGAYALDAVSGKLTQAELAKLAPLKDQAVQIAEQIKSIANKAFYLDGGGSQFIEWKTDDAVLKQSLAELDALVARYNPEEIKAAVTFIATATGQLESVDLAVPADVAFTKAKQALKNPKMSETKLSKLAAIKALPETISSKMKMGGLVTILAELTIVGGGLVLAIEGGSSPAEAANYRSRLLQNQKTKEVLAATNELHEMARNHQDDKIQAKLDLYTLQAARLSSQIIEDSKRIDVLKQSLSPR